MAEIFGTVALGNRNFFESETHSSSSSEYHSSRIERLSRSRTEYRTALDFEIAASKDHWSELQQSSSGGETQKASLSKGEIVESLRKQFPHSGNFFVDYGDRVQLGRKLGEGGQAEIFEGSFRGHPEDIDVFKVFKEGSSVLELQRQWPANMLVDRSDQYSRGYFSCDFTITPINGTVLMNGRFAFHMTKCSGDLRKLIDTRMLHNSSASAPFNAKELKQYMQEIALAMMGLHKNNIVHRDLKASNVLLQELHGGDLDSFGLCSYMCLVADFECSVGVVGTKFWRAPEILQGVKDHNITSDLFTEASDVYSYGMTCYEMITGRLPFEEVRAIDYDVVLRGGGLRCQRRLSLGSKRCWVDVGVRPVRDQISRKLSNYLEGENLIMADGRVVSTQHKSELILTC